MSEEWLPVVDYEGLYEVSDHGNIRSVTRTVARIDSGSGSAQRLKGRVRKTHPNDHGRLCVTLYKGGKGQRFQVHRIMAAAFLGPCPEGQEVCHTDDDYQHNHISNLRYDTRSENWMDTVAAGNHSQARKTHCPKGHEYTAANTYTPPGKVSRSCRTCIKASKLQWQRANRDAQKKAGTSA